MLAALALSLAASAPDAAFVHDLARDRVGRIYYYERSNRDGTRPEQIAVYRRSPVWLGVYKHVSLCTNAAYVTADLDLATMSASHLSAGRLAAAAQRDAFGDLDFAGETMRLQVRLPDFELDQTHDVGPGPQHIYDFDLASLTVATPHLSDPDAPFEAGFPLIWPDFEAENFVQVLGRARFEPAGEDMIDGETARRYAVSGALTGALWLDPEDGHIIRAEFDQPNHPGYDDFKLDLKRVSDGGEAEWSALLTAHYADCEQD